MVASAVAVVAVVVTVVAVVVVDVILELIDVHSDLKNPPHVNIAEGELD